MQRLHLACYNADLELVQEMLTNGESPNDVDEHGCTPLYWSCFRGAVGDQGPVVSFVLDAGADPNLSLNGPVGTPLTAAIESGNVDLVRLLIDRGAKPNMLTSQGVSPLMVAARCGDTLVAKLLLEVGAETDHECEGYTAAHYAEHYGHPEIVDVICSWETQRR